MNLKFSAAAAVTLAVTLALTGCGAPSAPANGGSRGGSPAPEASAPTGSGSELALPDTFPKNDVPLIEGDLAYTQDLGTGWVVYVHRDDFLAGYQEAVGLLDGAGFTGQTINQDDTGAVGQWVSDLVTVNLSAGDGSDLGVGPSVGYTVVKNGE